MEKVLRKEGKGWSKEEKWEKRPSKKSINCNYWVFAWGRI